MMKLSTISVIGVAASLLLSGSLCGRPEAGGPAQQRSRPAAQAGEGEQQVRYYPLIQAYEQGKYANARDLAKTYLNQYAAQLDTKNVKDKQAAIQAQLDVLRVTLQGENQLPQNDRFGRDTQTLNLVNQKLQETRKAAASIEPKIDDTNRRFIQDSMAKNEVRLIDSGRALLSRDELEQLYEQYNSDLQGLGLQNLDDVLDKAPDMDRESTEPKKKSRGVSDEDLSQMFLAMRRYFDAIQNNDKPALQAVTRAQAPAATQMMTKYSNELRKAKIQKITTFTIPELSDQNAQVSKSSSRNDVYFVYVKGIRIDYQKLDGNTESRVINKLFGMQKEQTGTWSILPPK